MKGTMTTTQQKSLKSAIKVLIDLEEFALASTLMEVVKNTPVTNGAAPEPPTPIKDVPQA